MNPFEVFLKSKGYTVADFEGFDETKQAQIQNDYLGHIESQMKGFMTAEQVKEATKGLATVEQMSNLENMIKSIKDSQTLQIGKGALTKLEEQVKEVHTSLVEAIEKGDTSFKAVLKAPATHLTTNTVTGLGVGDLTSENVRTIAGFSEIPVPEDFVLTFIPNRVVDNVPSTVVRYEQAPTEGAFAIVAEGGTKPLLQYKFVKTSTDRKKIAGRIEWSEEFAKDYQMLFAEIVRKLRTDFISDYQDKLFAEIVANATPYVSSTLDGTLLAPDNGLAIVAGQTQSQALNFRPNIVVMHPSDLVATLFQQDANGNLKLHPYINVTAGTINGMRYIANNRVTQGTTYVGDSSRYDETHENPTLRVVQYGNQAIENKYTALIESFFVLSIAELDLASWVEVDLEAVKALLEVAP